MSVSRGRHDEGLMRGGGCVRPGKGAKHATSPLLYSCRDVDIAGMMILKSTLTASTRTFGANSNKDAC